MLAVERNKQINIWQKQHSRPDRGINKITSINLMSVITKQIFLVITEVQTQLRSIKLKFAQCLKKKNVRESYTLLGKDDFFKNRTHFSAKVQNLKMRHFA